MVRVVLLFYLMPLWALLLARVVLKEPLTRLAVVRVVLALVGAALVLAGAGCHERRDGRTSWSSRLTLPDMLAVLGRIRVRAEQRRDAAAMAAQPAEGRAFAMPPPQGLSGRPDRPRRCLPAQRGSRASTGRTRQAPGPCPAFGLAIAFLASNLCLQYGAQGAPIRPAATAVVMPCEVLFAALTAVWWGDSTLHVTVLLGGALILLATLASVFEGQDTH